MRNLLIGGIVGLILGVAVTLTIARLWPTPEKREEAALRAAVKKAWPQFSDKEVTELISKWRTESPYASNKILIDRMPEIQAEAEVLVQKAREYAARKKAEESSTRPTNLEGQEN